MKKGVITAAVVLLALLTAAGVMLTTKNKDSPPVRIMDNTMDSENTNTVDNELLTAQNNQIAELRAQIDSLERKLAQQEFDYTAVQAERDALRQRSRDLEEQNRYLRDRNSTLSTSEDKLKTEVAALDSEISALDEKLEQLEAQHEKDEAAYQEALARIEEYEARIASAQAALDKANTPGNTRVTEDGTVVSTYKSIPSGQSRNIIGIKAGESDIDIEAAFALMPHWFLVTEIGIADAPDDFVETEFPGLKADHAYMYTALFGTGLNWRFENLPGQPNFFIETMLGPAWFRYNDKYHDEKGINSYLLWRSAVGFDLTLYKSLQFTTEVGLDYMINCELTPRVTIGLQYNFGNRWALLGRK